MKGLTVSFCLNQDFPPYNIHPCRDTTARAESLIQLTGLENVTSCWRNRDTPTYSNQRDYKCWKQLNVLLCHFLNQDTPYSIHTSRDIIASTESLIQLKALLFHSVWIKTVPTYSIQPARDTTASESVSDPTEGLAVSLCRKQNTPTRDSRQSRLFSPFPPSQLKTMLCRSN